MDNNGTAGCKPFCDLLLASQLPLFDILSGGSIMITKDVELEIIDKYNSGININKLSKEYNLDWHWIEKMLTRNNVVLRKQYKINEYYFDVIDTPNKAYILGFLYADGSNTSNYNMKRYCITIVLQASDSKILYDIKDEIGYEAPIKFREYNGCKTATLDICNKHMVLKLHEFGVVPNKTLTIQFPKWLDEELYPHFIRGYFDGDGCITHNSRDVSPQLETTIVGTVDMCTAISNIVTEKCNVNAHVYDTGHDRCNKNIKTFVVFGNLQCKRFLNYIYQNSDLKLQRKYNKYIDWYSNK